MALPNAETPTNIQHTISTPAARIRRGKEVRLVLANPADADDGQVDPALVGLIVRAHAARQSIISSPQATVSSIAASQGLTVAYFALLLRLSMLAPDIIAAILVVRQPALLTRQQLARVTNLPIAWDWQRSMRGFT